VRISIDGLRWIAGIVTFVAATGVSDAQPSGSPDEIARVHAAVSAAFDFLYKLPRDTAGAALGSWVLDTDATTMAADQSGQWRIVVTKLADTGQALKVEEMAGQRGTSPTQLAAAMAEMQQLEAKISKAEAEASLEVVVALDDPDESASDAPAGAYTENVVQGPWTSRLTRGHWRSVEDRQLGLTVERWVPARLDLRLTPGATGRARSVVVTAQGNEEMIERLLKESRWKALATIAE
jgi:hypothetical protein